MISYDLYEVKLLLQLVVETSCHVALNIQVYRVYLSPKWITSVCFCRVTYGSQLELLQTAEPCK